MFCQVRFHVIDKEYDDNENNEYGGLAKYGDENTLKYVICGCCGGVFRADQIEIRKYYKNWSNISDSIAVK